MANPGRTRRQIDLAFRVSRTVGLRERGMRWAAASTRHALVRDRLSGLVGPANLTARFLPVNVELAQPESVVLPTVVLERFVRAACCRVALHRCLCRDLYECHRHPRRIGCLFLGSAAARIHPTMGRRVSVDEAMARVQEALGLGLVALAGKVSADALVLGVKDHAHLMTVCFCCSCCCTARFARYLAAPAREGLRRLEGVEVEVSDACDGCGVCLPSCVAGALEVVDDRVVVGASCLGCGRCTRACPKDAIRLHASDSSLVTRAIDTLASVVDVG